MRIFEVKHKKGFQFSLITGMVIALVVMIILIYMFSGKARTFEKGLSACTERGGVVAEPKEGKPAKCEEGHSYLFSMKDDKICCYPE